MSIFSAKPTGDARQRKLRSARHGLFTKSPVSFAPTSAGHNAQAIARSHFQAMADHSAQAQQSAQLQAMADKSPRQIAQRQALELLSGDRSEEKHQGDGRYSYARASRIHLSGGEKNHSAHESGQVVRQMRGPVPPTTSAGDVAVNERIRKSRQDSPESPGFSRSDAAAGTIRRKGMTEMLPTLAPYSRVRRADSKTPRITTSVQRYAEGARPEAYRENSVQMRLDRDVMQARFYSGGNAYVAQMVDWAYWSKLGAGVLVLSEGALTVAAGSLAINVNPMAAIPTIVTGGIKLIRGAIMMGETLISGSYPDPEHQVNKVLRGLTKSLRTLEAIGAGLAVGLGAVYTLEHQQKLGTELVALGSSFAGIKLLRSLGHWFIDNGKPSYGSMVLQGVETLEGALLAVGAARQRTIPGMELAVSVGSAKILRGAAGAFTHGVKRKQQGVSSKLQEGYKEIN